MSILSDDLIQKVKNFDTSTITPEQTTSFSAIWSFLKASEEEFIEMMHSQSETGNGNVEYGPALYILNNDIGSITTEFLRKYLNMPTSRILPGQWSTWWDQMKNGPGVVATDGTLFVNSPYAGLDTGWYEALVYYFIFKVDSHGVATFGTSPATLTVTNPAPLSIAIVGDWGTGPYNDSNFSSSSTLVGQAIAAKNPDITIHLGDVYYAGRSSEETDKLLANFPAGSLASFTLNSNHEMYDGANGYFSTALGNATFVGQQGTSYFAILYQDWVILGVDTAYYDKSSMYMDGALTDDNQLSFIRGLNISDSQKIIFLSHHVGLALDGQSTNDPLFGQVQAALGRYPDYWYYGHVHNAIVYNNNAITGTVTCPSGLNPQLRCVGHGAIPFGNAVGLHDTSGTMIPAIDYYAHNPMPNPNGAPLIQLRVQNGFMMITLGQGTISESAYEVAPNDSNGVTTTLAWQSTPAG